MGRKQRQAEIVAPLTAEELIKEVAPVSESEAALVSMAIAPSVKAAATIKDYTKNFGDVSLPGLVLELARQVDAVTSGDLARTEGILVVQAYTLDAMFNNLASAAAKTSRIDH